MSIETQQYIFHLPEGDQKAISATLKQIAQRQAEKASHHLKKPEEATVGNDLKLEGEKR